MTYKRLTLIFFGIYLLAGIFIYRDYGLNWDDDFSHKYGLMNWNYVFNNDSSLQGSMDRYHGPALEMTLVGIDKIFAAKGTRAVFQIHHFADFVFFYLSVIAFFLLARKLFGADKWGLLACLMLVLSPRIFGDSFFNSKDIGFLCGCILTLYTLYRLYIHPNYVNLLIHTFVCGFTTDIRVLGLIFVPFAIVLLIKNIIDDPASRKRNLTLLLLYPVFLAGFIILFWPYLWSSPLAHLQEALVQMKKYPWDYGIFYLGKNISTKNLPWHYLPLWIVITTPAVFSLLYLIGTAFIVRNFILHPVRFLREQIMLGGIWLLGIMPVLSVIILKSVVYDGWRHVFFIYPFFILVTTLGFKDLYEWVSATSKKALRVFMGFYLSWLLCVTIYLHPFENIYFNVPALLYFKPISEQFELDYWGLSYKQALDYIIAHTKAKAGINIYSTSYFGPNFLNRDFLKATDKGRINFVYDTAIADYFMTIRRWKAEPQPPADKIVYQPRRFGIPIVTVYKF